MRDAAAVLALAAESRPVPAIVPDLSKVVAKEWQTKRYTSTQEQVWTLLSARALQNGDENLRVEVNGNARAGAYAKQVSGDQLIAEPIMLTNRSRIRSRLW